MLNSTTANSIPETAKKGTNPKLAAMIGTLLEYYDSSLYGFMIPLLAPILLPHLASVDAYIIGFLLYPLGLLTRPLGALVIGSIGDIYGRRNALLVSICGTALMTGLIGCLPPYAAIGLAAPIIFAFLKLSQKFFVAGEYNGGAIFTLEHSNKGFGYISGLYCGFTVLGTLIANGVTTLIAHVPEAWDSFAWRIPFFLGFGTAIFAIFLRLNTEESPAFLKERAPTPPLLGQFIKYWKPILANFLIAGFFSTLYCIPALFLNAFLPEVTPFSKETILIMTTITMAVYMVALPIFGLVGDQLQIQRSMTIALILSVLLAFPLFILIKTNNWHILLGVKIIFALLCAWYVGPYHAWAQKLFPTHVRYRWISLSYSIGSQMGAMTPSVAFVLWKNTHMTTIPSTLIIAWGALGFIGLTLGKNLPKYE